MKIGRIESAVAKFGSLRSGGIGDCPETPPNTDTIHDTKSNCTGRVELRESSKHDKFERWLSLPIMFRLL